MKRREALADSQGLVTCSAGADVEPKFVTAIKEAYASSSVADGRMEPPGTKYSRVTTLEYSYSHGVVESHFPGS